MPGILGINRPQPFGPDVTATLDRMAEPLRYAPDQTVQHFRQGGFAGSVVDYGPDFAFLKSAIAKRDGVVLLMDGEVFPDASEVPHQLQESTGTVQRAEYCIHQYLNEGPSFVNRLNGSFALTIWDGRIKRLRLFADRFSSRCLFYWYSEGRCAVASSLRSLLAMDKHVGREYDKIAVAELIGFERVCGAKTLFSDIKRLAGGCYAEWDGQKWTTNQYMDVASIRRDRRPTSPKDAAYEMLHCLKVALGKRVSREARCFVLLSGGLDSRLVFAAGGSNVGCATFSNREHKSRECAIAEEIAAARDTYCLRMERGPEYYAANAESAVTFTDGMATFVGVHTVGVHEQIIQAGYRTALTGMFFDTAFKSFFGKALVSSAAYENEPSSLRGRRIGRILVDTSLVRKPARLDLAYLALSTEMKDALAVARERRVQSMAEWFKREEPISQLADRFPFADLASAGGFVGFLWGLRSHLVDRSPIYDNQLLELALAIPQEWKANGLLVRLALKLQAPALAKIPDNNTGLPAGLCPPWSTMCLGLRSCLRSGARFVAKRSRLVESLRNRPGKRIFSSGAWHDLDAALKVSAPYRELVDQSIDRLDQGLFDVDRIRELLRDDLSTVSPRFGTLFQTLITFATFDHKWGPRARTA